MRDRQSFINDQQGRLGQHVHLVTRIDQPTDKEKLTDRLDDGPTDGPTDGQRGFGSFPLCVI